MSGVLQSAAVIVTADTIQTLMLFSGYQWGIFSQSGSPLVVGDSVDSIDYRNENTISDYKVEQGGFATYNKVATPFDLRISFNIGGTVSDRAQFLATAEAMTASLDLYHGVTPEATYLNIDVVHFSYNRTVTNGATMMLVDFYCREVRIAAPATYSNVQAPDSADPQVNGSPQTTPTTVPAAKVIAVNPVFNASDAATGTGQSTGGAVIPDTYQVASTDVDTSTTRTAGYVAPLVTDNPINTGTVTNGQVTTAATGTTVDSNGNTTQASVGQTGNSLASVAPILNPNAIMAF